MRTTPKVLVEELEEPLDRQSGELKKTIYERLGQMSKDGWQKCHSMFREKFGRNITLENLNGKQVLQLPAILLESAYYDDLVKRWPRCQYVRRAL